jgi:hypothetical protein
MRNKFDALDATVINSFEATAEQRVEGHSSSIGWLKHHCRESGQGASRRRRLARQLRGMPVAEQALREGRITVEHVAVLAIAQRRVGEHDFGLAEEALVDTGAELRFGDFVHTVDYFVKRADPNGESHRESQDFEERGASSSETFGGSGKVNANFDGLGFPVWQAELERLTDQLYEQDWAAARDELGRRPLPSELGRTTRQRRVDAMVLMAQRSAAFDGEPGPSRFQLVVHADSATVAELLAVLIEALNDDDPDTEHYLDDI